MSSTDGLMRGMEAEDTGAPIKVPVGDACLGRVFNVLGRTVDHNPAPVGNKESWPIHRPAPKFDEQETSTQILETGIKVVDLIAPYSRGGKIGLFGGAGVGGGSYSGGRCFRSPNSTGNLYAESLRKRGADVKVRDVSCANSRIEQVTISQKSAVLGSSVINGPQAEGVSSGTDLVVMTIGGNDMGFGSLLKTCLITKSQADECRNSIAEARRSLNDVEGKYRRIFSAIRQRGLRSDATIAVMAYPMLVRDDSFTLRDSSGATVHVSDEIRALSREGNKKMAEIVKADNASHPGQTIFVSDVADRFEGHQPHADRSKDDGDDLWIHPINYFAVGNFISWYHPNSAGYRQYAAALQDKLKSAGFERSLAKQKGAEHDKDSGQGRASKQGSASSQGDASRQGNAS